MSDKSRINTRKSALGAMLIALGVVLIYIGAVTEVLDLSLCAAASLITVFAVIEFGRPFAYMIYAATTVLSLLLLPNKFAAAAYAFTALYSIIKSNIERLNKTAAWIIKLVYFNVILVLGFMVSKYVFMFPDEGMLSLIGLFVLGNIVFVLFDIAVTRLIALYVFRLRRRFKIDKYIRGMR